MATRKADPGRGSAGEGKQDTRTKLLEVAGAMFAENGYERTTAKEIAKRADTNAAAVNYYFGGIEGLYRDVLLHARKRLFDDRAMFEAIGAAGDAEARLRGFYRFIVAKVMSPSSVSWNMRVIIREIMSPSQNMETLLDRSGEPRHSFFAFLAAHLGLAEDDPRVTRVAFSVSTPCLMLLLADPRSIAQMFPGLVGPDADVEPLVDHLTRFAMAGIGATEAS